MTPRQMNCINHGRDWYQVGDDILILENKYDKDQLWLPFVTRVLFQNEGRYVNGINVSQAWQPIAGLNRARLNSTAILARHSYDKEKIHLPFLIAPTSGLPQLYLPFDEYRNIAGKDLDAHYSADFPYFDRDENLDLFEIISETLKGDEAINDAIEWCQENLQGRYAVEHRLVTIEREDDYLFARLKF